MSAARDYTPLPPILGDADWSCDWLYYGADTTAAADFPDGSTFSLVFAPEGQAQPDEADVHELTSGAGITQPAGNAVSASSAKASHADWTPGWYLVEKRRTGPGVVFEPLYVGRVCFARGLSQLAELGGGDLSGVTGQGSVSLFRDADQVRVVRGEAAGVLALAEGFAASAEADAEAAHTDRLAADADAEATAADRVQTGQDRTATGQDRTQTGLDRAAATSARQDAVEAAGDAQGYAAIATTEAGEAADSAADALALVSWIPINGATLAVSHRQYLCDSSVAAFPLTLPANPVAGDQVRAMDAVGGFAAHPVTVQRNGQTIAGSASDLVLNVNWADVTFAFTGTTWVF